MRTTYPEDYTGPKAGGSDDKEWLNITEYQAFCWVQDGTWYYSDFDCWLSVRATQHVQLGRDSLLDSIRGEVEKIITTIKQDTEQKKTIC